MSELNFKFNIGDIVRHKATKPTRWFHEVNYFILGRCLYEDAHGTHRGYVVRSVRSDGEAGEEMGRLWEIELESVPAPASESEGRRDD